MTTHEKIELRIALLKSGIKRLEENLKIIPDEPATKICPECKTKNYHYYAKSNTWCCAFC